MAAAAALPPLDPTHLSIFKFSEPILSQQQQQSEDLTSSRPSHAHLRQSDASSHAGDNATPASLQADLAHYKELFTKLRFSYVEQVTKEKFLRAVVGDPPLYASHNEISDLEFELSSTKGRLKSRKLEVASMIEELEARSRDISQRYLSVAEQQGLAQQFPSELEELQAEIENLKESQAAVDGEGEGMNLSLPETMGLVEEQEGEMEELDRELEEMEEAAERKERELASLEEELGSLRKQKTAAITAAKQARIRKEAGGAGPADALEERGRYLRGVESTMRGLFEA